MDWIKGIVEQPKSTDVIYAVIGLNFYTNDVIDLVKSFELFEIGKLEQNSLSQNFLNLENLNKKFMSEGYIQVDPGTQVVMNNKSNSVITFSN